MRVKSSIALKFDRILGRNATSHFGKFHCGKTRLSINPPASVMMMMMMVMDDDDAPATAAAAAAAAAADDDDDDDVVVNDDTDVDNNDSGGTWRLWTCRVTRSPTLEENATLWKIQRLPCDFYGICWQKISIWMDFTYRYVLERIFNGM